MTRLEVEVTAAGTGVEAAVAVGVPVFAAEPAPELAAGVAGHPALAGGVAELAGTLDPTWCAQRGFAARPGQVLHVGGGPGRPALALVGLGSRAGLDPERWRRAAAALVRSAGERGAVAFLVPDSALAGPPPGTDGAAGRPPAAVTGAALAEGAVLAAYRFDPFRSAPRPGAPERLLVVPGTEAIRADLARGTGRGARAARAVSFARDLINTPPSHLPPARMAERVADELGGIEGVRVEVWDEARAEAERLGGLLGVSRGSVQPPRLVWATFEPAGPAGPDESGRPPHIVLVGKGITFDSGGLSLKTAEGMTTMKTDMSGAAIVLSTLAACRDLGVGCRVTALAPLAENMPGGRALKPGDVLTIRNGATVEVLNTDAEGRLVLADALSLAAELEPDAIVDVATLTGAATVALGRGIAALFGNDERLVERVRRSGELAGERLWPLPLPEDYQEHIDSDVADMKNVGRAGEAGAIAAALLLARFVKAVPWAHLDIAGTGRSAESSGYVSKGGTGFGVRTLLELLASYDRPPG
ncbi:MAG TPA: leucyl aminopeptidase [Acidimicrobiales bacterium]|nr:leucyl aminopeptidase [Acidimicrobiales bacterium]